MEIKPEIQRLLDAAGCEVREHDDYIILWKKGLQSNPLPFNSTFEDFVQEVVFLSKTRGEFEGYAKAKEDNKKDELRVNWLLEHVPKIALAEAENGNTPYPNDLASSMCKAWDMIHKQTNDNQA